MTFDPNVHVGVAAWIERGDNVLLMKRADNATHGGGTWALPGGWVDQYESPRSTVLRELEEEVGVTTDDTYVELLHVVANDYHTSFGNATSDIGTVVCVVYRVELDHDHDPKILEPDKASNLAWVPKEFMFAADQRVRYFPALGSLLHDRPDLLDPS